MKTDFQLQKDVMDELRWEPSVDHTNIGVTARNGVVTLAGFVPNYAQKAAAEMATRRVAGVRAIAEEIQVRFAVDPRMTDAEIAERILNRLSWDVTAPEGIRIKVEQGRVTLTGQVDWNYQKEIAGRAAGRTTGVTTITNLIEVKAKPSPKDVRERIVSALRRSSELDANAINVSVDGGTVKLSGRVKGWNERRVAESAAWSAPGVSRVQDDIVFA
jgi:osmotically-inducible protein OsmY